MKRVLCVWLPQWPGQRRRLAEIRGRSSKEQASTGSAWDDDPFEDLAGLYRLAGWCERFSPTVGLEDADPPECLLLDVTGCGPVFGGERALIERAARQLGRGSFDARLAVADTVGAAWAAAHFIAEPNRVAMIPTGRSKAALASLRPDALRLPIETVHLLEELGIRQVGQLDAVPRKELAARLGPQTVERLAQMWGEVLEVIVSHRQAEIVQEEWCFEYPTDRYEIIESILEILTRRMTERLRDVRGVQRLSCQLCPERGPPLVCTAEMYRPCSDPARLLEMIRLRLESACLPAKRKLRKTTKFSAAAPDENAAAKSKEQVRRLMVDGLPPIAIVRLRALATELLQSRQEELFDDRTGRNDPAHAAELVERLTNRLGRQRVLRTRLLADAQPERAFACEPVVDSMTRTRSNRKAAKRPTKPRRWRPTGPLEVGGVDRTVDPADPRHGVWNVQHEAIEIQEKQKRLTARPLRLFAQPAPIHVLAIAPNGPPMRFLWQNVEYRIVEFRGPERIETGWWRGPDVRRDYYRVDTAEGLRFWVFRRLQDGAWYLHGAFD